VVLADDHQEMIAIIPRTLGEQFEVVSTVGNGKQAVDAVHTLNQSSYLFVPDSFDWIEPGRSVRRNPAGQQSNERQQ
jgi:CheY-like chemotaxis protein